MVAIWKQNEVNSNLNTIFLFQGTLKAGSSFTYNIK